MLKLLNLLLLAARVTTNIVPRAGISQIKSDLTTLNSDWVNLGSAFKSWDGSLVGAVTIQNAFNTTDRDTNTTIIDAQATTPLTVADTQTIIDYINSTLEPNINSTLKVIVSKSSQIRSVGLSSYVASELKQLRSDTARLGNTLVGLSPSSKQAAMKAAFVKIDNDFKAAIVAQPGARDLSHYSKRATPATIETNLNTLNNDYAAAHNHANAYSNFSDNTPSFLDDLRAADDDTRTTSNGLKASAMFTTTQAQTLIVYIEKHLEPTVIAAMTAIKGTWSRFSSTGLNSFFCTNLQQLQSDSSALGSVFLGKTPSSKKTAATKVFNKIKADIQIAVDQYCP